jgi:hypothetical protein
MGLVLGLVWTICGCFNPWDPREAGLGVTEPPPVPTTPSLVLQLLEWSYKNRAIAEYREIFSDDYRFVFGTLDPYGNAYRSTPWTRDDEVESTTHLFQGGDASQPAATNISIMLDRNFNETNDPRYGPSAARWHKLIRTSVTLHITTEGGDQNVAGYGNFFLVRGDSAIIPLELRQRGFGPDSNRWYIQRHEDDTYQDNTGGGGATANRARPAAVETWVERSWGYLKALYH